MECEFLNNCPFFNDLMEVMPSTSSVFKKIYCHGNNDNCARYMLAKSLGAERIPPSIMPNNRKIAVKMISDQLNA